MKGTCLKCSFKIIDEIINEIYTENKALCRALQLIEFEVGVWIRIINVFGNKTHKKTLNTTIKELREEFDKLFKLLNNELHNYKLLLPNHDLTHLQC